MSTTGRAFNRVITAGTAGYEGDDDPVGTLEINDGVADGRAWQMTDYPNPADTYEVSGTIETTQAATLFNLALWRLDSKNSWEFVQQVDGLASGDPFQFGAIPDGTIFVQIFPVDALGDPVVVLDTETVTLKLSLDMAQDEGKITLFERIAGDPDPVADRAILYAKEVAGVTEVFSVSSDGTVVQLTGIAGDAGWTHAAGLVRATTATDDVVIGAAVMEATERLRVVNSVALVLALETVDAGAVGCTIATYHNSPSPAALDAVARISHYGEDDGGGKTEYVRQEARALAVGAGVEVGSYAIAAQDGAGNLVDCLGVTYSGIIVNGFASPTLGPEVSINSTKAAGADGDTVGSIGFYGNDDSPAAEVWGQLAVRIVDASNTTEEGLFALALMTAGTFTPDILTVSGSTTEVTRVSAGATGPTLSLYHSSTTPADLDVVARISMFGHDDNVGLNKTEYGRIEVIASDVSDLSEDSVIDLYAMDDGTLTLAARFTAISGSSAWMSTLAAGATSAFVIRAANNFGNGQPVLLVQDNAGGSTLFRIEGDGDAILTGGLGMFGVTPPTQHAKIADPAGGGTVDAESRTAINALIDVVEAMGASALA